MDAGTMVTTLESTIRGVYPPKSTVILTGMDGKDLSISVTPGAKVTLDGKPVLLGNLRPGQRAKVTHTDNKANAVEATSVKTK